MEETDLPKLAACFDNSEDYVEKFGLTRAEQTDVKTETFRRGTQAGVKEALKCWTSKNPYEATFRALLLILLSVFKGDIAVQVCKYLYLKGKAVANLFISLLC